MKKSYASTKCLDLITKSPDDEKSVNIALYGGRMFKEYVTVLSTLPKRQV
jgi:hypothetical protein